jgi:hypothetical protein
MEAITADLAEATVSIMVVVAVAAAAGANFTAAAGSATLTAVGPPLGLEQSVCFSTHVTLQYFFRSTSAQPMLAMDVEVIAFAATTYHKDQLALAVCSNIF